MRLVERLVRWLDRRLPPPASPDAIEAREDRTEDVRTSSIEIRKDAERLGNYKRVTLGRR